MAQNDTDETLAWLAKERASGSTKWGGLCLMLARTARGIPAMYPSAIAAQTATPSRFRVYDKAKITKGMVVYFDDPNDSNPFGHIVTVHGKDKDGNLLVWTNLAPGKVALVQFDYFTKNWGDAYQFAATWLNGQELIMPAKPPPPRPIPKGGGDNIRQAIRALGEAIDYHEDKGHHRLVRALKRDRNDLRETLKRWS